MTVTYKQPCTLYLEGLNVLLLRSSLSEKLLLPLHRKSSTLLLLDNVPSDKFPKIVVNISFQKLHKSAFKEHDVLRKY